MAVVLPPARTSSKRARSATDCAIGPTVSRVWESGATPSPGYRPTVGRNAAQPLKEQGIRTDPPVSVPNAAGAIRAPSAAPLPADEPPATRVESYALRTPICP